MEPTVIAALITSMVAILSLVFGYTQWRRDVKIKLNQIREAVSVELIQQRVEPYADFMRRLELMSSLHLNDLRSDHKKVLACFKVIQDAVYGKVGLLASHHTRQILLYARTSFQHFAEGNISSSELTTRLWCLHFSLRSDLGIEQPQWPSELERVHTAALKDDRQAFESLIKSYPWDEIDSTQRNPMKENVGNNEIYKT